MHYLNGQQTQADIDLYKSYSNTLKSVIFSEFRLNIKSLTKEIIAKFDSDNNVSSDKNVSIQVSWQGLSVTTGYHPSPFPAEDNLVGNVGRTAYILPIYREMMAVDRDQAWNIFQKHINFYHPITRGILNDLFSSSQSE